MLYVSVTEDNFNLDFGVTHTDRQTHTHRPIWILVCLKVASYYGYPMAYRSGDTIQYAQLIFMFSNHVTYKYNQALSNMLGRVRGRGRREEGGGRGEEVGGRREGGGGRR